MRGYENIENKLQPKELKHLLKPFLELADKDQIFVQQVENNIVLIEVE
jgi:hypothetical protein